MQYVQDGVIPRQDAPPFAVDCEPDRPSEQASRRGFADDVPDAIVRVRMRGYDGERFTAAHANHTGIRRLATATRIEAGPITSDRVLLHGNHGGVGFEAMGVVEGGPGGGGGG